MSTQPESGVSRNFLRPEEVPVGRPEEAPVGQMITIAADHPALPGHFPGRPIVPGVVLLDQALLAVLPALAAGRTLLRSEIASAKFLSPVGPGETLQLQTAVQSTGDVDTVRFEIGSASDAAPRKIASGIFKLHFVPRS